MVDLPQKDYSEEAFCRYFLAIKRWQQVRNPDMHTVMEKIMYLRMNRSADCIKNDETIKTILGIRCLDSVAIFSLIADSTDVSKDAYFNYIRRNKGVREYESDSSLIINSDDECAVRNRRGLCVCADNVAIFFSRIRKLWSSMMMRQVMMILRSYRSVDQLL